MLATSVQNAIEMLDLAHSLLVITGAGISVSQGLPTYRGPGGLYTDGGIPPATTRRWRQDPMGILRWLDERWPKIRASTPSKAHQAIALWEQSRRFERLLVVTQNTDGLHAKAGSQAVVRVHGRMGEWWQVDAKEAERTAMLTATKGYRDLGYSELEWAIEVSNNADGRISPVVKWYEADYQEGRQPNLVMFGQDYGPRRAAIDWFLREPVDIVLVVGCSGGVSLAPSIAAAAKRQGATVIEVNPSPSGHFDADVSIVAGAEVLPTLDSMAG
ncbi:MAG: hypothetical protein HN348_24770 [Proteobacteria bacterium]|nr:hypothetical protein [Pseudomonadota bacterium]